MTEFLIFEEALNLEVLRVDIALVILEGNARRVQNVGDQLRMECTWRLDSLDHVIGQTDGYRSIGSVDNRCKGLIHVIPPHRRGLGPLSLLVSLRLIPRDALLEYRQQSASREYLLYELRNSFNLQMLAI